MNYSKVGRLEQLAKGITSEFKIELIDGNNSVVIESRKDDDDKKVEVGFH